MSWATKVVLRMRVDMRAELDRAITQSSYCSKVVYGVLSAKAETTTLMHGRFHPHPTISCPQVPSW